jgi:hypothetical protein
MNTSLLKSKLTSQTNTVNKMGKFNKAAIALTLMASCFLSVNASAAQNTSIEGEISAAIISQSQQVLAEISHQLQQSIDSEIKVMAKGMFNNSIISFATEANEAKQEAKQETKKALSEVKQ